VCTFAKIVISEIVRSKFHFNCLEMEIRCVICEAQNFFKCNLNEIHALKG
jgi:hypothetical protein